MGSVLLSGTRYRGRLRGNARKMNGTMLSDLSAPTIIWEPHACQVTTSSASRWHVVWREGRRDQISLWDFKLGIRFELGCGRDLGFSSARRAIQQDFGFSRGFYPLGIILWGFFFLEM